MIPSAVAFRVAVVALAFGAGCFVTHNYWSAKYEKEKRKAMEASVAFLKNYDENVKVKIDDYRTKLNAANSRPARRVLFCPDDDMPSATGGVVSTHSGKPDNYDYGPDLRAARDALIRCNALIEVVK